MTTKLYLIATFVAILCSNWNAVSAASGPYQVETYTRASYGERTTYDWGKHTGNDYDWGQHTGSTYDWGKHTSTQATNGDADGDQNHDQNQDQGGHMYQHRCGGGRYTCLSAPGLCIDLRQFCDGQVNCPHAEDENPEMCARRKRVGQGTQRYAKSNQFRGQGFMFHIKNVKVAGSHAKLFNQDSDSHLQKSG